MSNNAQTTVQLHSFYMLLIASLCSIILQARLQKYVNRDLPVVPAGFQRDRGIRDQTANMCWVMEKARKFQKKKNLLFASLTKLKPLTVWITTNCGKFLMRWEYRLSYLYPNKSICGWRSNSQNYTCNNRRVQNWKRNTKRQYIVTLLISFICRIPHSKCQTG